MYTLSNIIKAIINRKVHLCNTRSSSSSFSLLWGQLTLLTFIALQLACILNRYIWNFTFLCLMMGHCDRENCILRKQNYMLMWMGKHVCTFHDLATSDANLTSLVSWKWSSSFWVNDFHLCVSHDCPTCSWFDFEGFFCKCQTHC